MHNDALEMSLPWFRFPIQRSGGRPLRCNHDMAWSGQLASPPGQPAMLIDLVAIYGPVGTSLDT